MKNLKSLFALALMASLTCNALNAHAYQLPTEFATGASADAASGSISVTINNYSAAALPTQIAVSLKVPAINADHTLDRSRVTMIDAPAMARFSQVTLATPLQAHNCWVFVVTDVDQTNQIKAFWVR